MSFFPHCATVLAPWHPHITKKDRHCIKLKLLSITKRDLSSPHIFTALWSVTCRIHVLSFMFEDLGRSERQVFATYVTVINSSKAGHS